MHGMRWESTTFFYAFLIPCPFSLMENKMRLWPEDDMTLSSHIHAFSDCPSIQYHNFSNLTPISHEYI